MNRQPVMCVLSINAQNTHAASGLQADLLTMTALGCRVACASTGLMITHDQSTPLHYALPASLLQAQCRAILEDRVIHAIKIGTLFDIGQVLVIETLLQQYPNIPVILEWSSSLETPDAPHTAIRDLIAPLTHFAFLKYRHMRYLLPKADNVDAGAQALLECGIGYLILTNIFPQTEQLTTYLYASHRRLNTFHHTRQSQQAYQGAHATLCAAFSAYLTLGLPPAAALHHALQCTEQALHHSYRLGMGDYVPELPSFSPPHSKEIF